MVKNIVGLSVSEPWGRWSDSNLSSTVRISFKDPLPNRFKLVFNAQPFGPNSGQDLLVKLGTYTYKFKLIDGLYEYSIAIDLGGNKISNIDDLIDKYQKNKHTPIKRRFSDGISD